MRTFLITAAITLTTWLVCMPLVNAAADTQRSAIIMGALGLPKDEALAQKLDSLEESLLKSGTPQSEA
jgi:hypothetical protein